MLLNLAYLQQDITPTPAGIVFHNSHNLSGPHSLFCKEHTWFRLQRNDAHSLYVPVAFHLSEVGIIGIEVHDHQ